MNRREVLKVAGAALLVSGWTGAALSQQQVGKGLGLRFLPTDEFNKLAKSAATRADLPPSANVRSLLPPVGDQGQQGSCVGWAVGYGLGSAMNKRRDTARPNMSPSFIYNRGMLIDSAANAWARDCGTGMYIETALSFLQGFGVLPISAFPYEGQACSRLPGPQEDKLARPNRPIADWRVAAALNAVKESLANNLPAVIGLQLRQSFMSLSGQSVYAPPTSEPVEGGHAMLIVGYDDAKGAFEVMNSWGDNWGNRGFAWISYGTAQRDATVDGALRMYTVVPSV